LLRVYGNIGHTFKEQSIYYASWLKAEFAGVWAEWVDYKRIRVEKASTLILFAWGFEVFLSRTGAFTRRPL